MTKRSKPTKARQPFTLRNAQHWTTRRAYGRELAHIETPMGPVIQSLELELTDNTTYSWAYINPWAFLYHLCMINAQFFEFLRSCFDGMPACVALYTDDTTPGNVVRPIQSRKTCCIYWTFENFPCWFRGRLHGWLPYGVIHNRIYKKCKGEISGLLKIVMHTFCTATFNIVTGIRIYSVLEDIWLTIRGLVNSFIQDCDAHKCSLCQRILRIETMFGL